ncbi:MAG: sulfotransferase family 2 domain-containing protein [Arenicellales bacterium]
MFISHNYQLLFFEVPRTASRAITEALVRLDPQAPTALIRAVKRNLFAYHLYDAGAVERYPSYRLIAGHRNPFDRIRSHYAYRRVRGNPPILKTLDWPAYVSWASDPDSRPDIRGAMRDAPITELLPCDRVQHWLRFESLTDDWDMLGQTLGTKLPPLTRRNASTANAYAYDENLAARIVARFRSDFEYFGYDFDSWREIDSKWSNS